LTIILLPYSSNVVSAFIYCRCYGAKNSPVISYILYLFPWLLHVYCIPAWGVFASICQIGRIDAFCGISKDLFTFQELLHDSGEMLSRKMQSSMHCLNTLLPPKKTLDYVLRNSNTSYVLPQCSLGVFKRSFINWCLYVIDI